VGFSLVFVAALALLRSWLFLPKRASRSSAVLLQALKLTMPPSSSTVHSCCKAWLIAPAADRIARERDVKK
jgi:hypothetical protein